MHNYSIGKPNSGIWEDIVESIVNGECILVTGSGLFEEEGVSLGKRLLDYLGKDGQQNYDQFYQDVELFHFKRKKLKNKTFREIRKFYNDVLSSNPSIRKISEIPFQFTINLTPDKLLYESIAEINPNAQFSFYKKNDVSDNIRKPGEDFPLVYNMLGSVDSAESMVLTYDDLYDYFKSIFKNRSMPVDLKLMLKNINNFIFLGVPFNKWYLQLLLRELNIHKGGKEDYDFDRYALNQSLSEDEMVFCHEQFKIIFIEQGMDTFVDELHSRISYGNNHQNKLRKKIEKINRISVKIEKLLIEGGLEKAIVLFVEVSKGSSIHDHVLALSSSYSTHKKRMLAHTLYHEQIKVDEARMTTRLLELLQKFKLWEN